jgi:hypothetical protein
MTDTPDALIKKYQEAVFAFARDDEHVLGPAFDAMAVHGEALRARLTAGDAAIKRVAELERDVKTGIEAARAATNAYTLFTDRVTLAATGYEKQIADLTANLAAARAEIEKLQFALTDCITVFGVTTDTHFWKAYDEVISRAKVALAPKETNNG